MDPAVRTIPVAFADNAYTILIGSDILHRQNLKEVIPPADRVAIIASARVYELYRDRIHKVLNECKPADLMFMEDGEEYKNYQYAEHFFEWLLKKRFSRKSLMVAIGGGVVGDFAGFIASTFMRGISIVHIPTTLLAMVDSSIGGKVAVNISAGKNIVGTFHQPALIISDISFLDSLPERELKNGITETVKHALLGERELLDILRNHDLGSIVQDGVLERLVFLSAQFKSRVVMQDERESGLRSILNFGHTVGHAIESVLAYRGITHGEAVAMGIRAAMSISREIGWLGDEDIALYDELVQRYDLIHHTRALDQTELLEHMRYDKKNYDGRIHFVLMKGIGAPVYNQRVDEEIIRKALSSLVP